MEKDQTLAKHIFTFRRKIIHSVLAEIDNAKRLEEEKDENVPHDEEEVITPKKLPEDISESTLLKLSPLAEVRNY